MSWVAAAIGGSALIGAGSSIFGSNKASKAQQQAAANAIAAQERMYDTTRADLAPYRDMGKRAGTELEERLPYLTSDIDVTQLLEDPNSTPAKAYNFTRTQGLKATQNAAAARGLGVSGAALKGASAFATGLAKGTYQDLFNMENTNRTNAYSRLKGLIDTGKEAAAGTGTAGTAASKIAADAQIGAGNAQAAAYNAMGNSVKQASQNVAGWAYGNERGLYGPNRLVGAIRRAVQLHLQPWGRGVP